MGSTLGQPGPPFGKIGSTSRRQNNCQARISELQTGNPFPLRCSYTFSINARSARQAENLVHQRVTEVAGINRCSGGTEWYSFPPRRGVRGLRDAVFNILNRSGLLPPSSDWVESSINPSLSPNQSSQFVYNSKWRQVPCKGDELQHITYNCK